MKKIEKKKEKLTIKFFVNGCEWIYESHRCWFVNMQPRMGNGIGYVTLTNLKTNEVWGSEISPQFDIFDVASTGINVIEHMGEFDFSGLYIIEIKYRIGKDVIDYCEYELKHEGVDLERIGPKWRAENCNR